MLNFSLKQHRLAVGIAVAAAALTLAACGGGSNDNASNSPVPPTSDNPLPVVTADSFITIVKALITVTDETSEPKPIDGVTATTPDTTAPDPVP